MVDMGRFDTSNAFGQIVMGLIDMVKPVEEIVIKHGDKISFTVVGPDAHNKYTGTVFVDSGVYRVKIDNCNASIMLDDLVDVHLLNL